MCHVGGAYYAERRRSGPRRAVFYEYDSTIERGRLDKRGSGSNNPSSTSQACAINAKREHAPTKDLVQWFDLRSKGPTDKEGMQNQCLKHGTWYYVFRQRDVLTVMILQFCHRNMYGFVYVPRRASLDESEG